MATTEGLIYAGLPDHVDDKSAQLGLAPKHKCTSLKKTYLTAFLQKNVSGKKFKNGIESELCHKSFVLDNVKPRSSGQSQVKRKKLSAREKRKMKLFDIKAEDQRYDMYTPLNNLWEDYMKDLIQFSKVTKSNLSEVERKLLKADLHGSIVMVTKSKCPSLIGAKGIVIQETKNTLKIITKENKLKVLPKQKTVFTLHLEGHVFTIYGNNFMFRSSDRASRNFKAKFSIDL